MIVPDVPVEAQQLPRARELACALVTATDSAFVIELDLAGGSTRTTDA
jgi:hypothetical protein